VFALLLVPGSMVACSGGSGDGLPPSPPSSSLPGSFDAVFSQVQDYVFTPGCAVSGCHTGAGAPQGLQLDSVNSYANLVGVASSENPSSLRVKPGDPDSSYLIQKLEGTASSGVRMPLGAAPLDASIIAIVRQWISDGAVDDRKQTAGPIRVAAMSPAPGSILDSSPSQILIGFDRDPDAATINGATFLVEASGGDGSFGDGNETAIAAASLTVPSANVRSAVFVPTGLSSDEVYRVTLRGSGSSGVLDLAGNALDGEFSGTFPSGNGTEGGDFVADFSIVTPPPAGSTLDEIQAAVFSVGCAACHSGIGSALPGVLDLSSADASFLSLVNVTSIEDGNFLRVRPGDPDNSYLVLKLEGSATVGEQMPQGGPPLDAAAIAAIRNWITNGALR